MDALSEALARATPGSLRRLALSAKFGTLAE